MPIAFPPAQRGNAFDRWKWQWGIPAAKVLQMNPNLARPGVPFTASLFDPGIGLPNARPNVVCLGQTYVATTNNATVNPIIKKAIHADDRTFTRVLGSLRMVLSGITRDTNSDVLGIVRVMIFRTQDMSFVGEITSDANGVWLLDMMKGGPFFFVVYKAGVPDVSGTSENTINPTQV